jgi:Fe-Mn family superoxide dismutase
LPIDFTFFQEGVMSEQRLDRREFIHEGAVAAAAAILSTPFGVGAADKGGKKSALVSMTPLPYGRAALEPHISEKTVDYHYGTHHKDYFDAVKAYVKTLTKYATMPLEKIIVKTKGTINEEQSLHYMSILLYNHNLYWRSLTPKGGGTPGLKLIRKIDKSYGSYSRFRKEFIKKAMKLGSGWVTLAQKSESLVLKRTDYHDSVLLHKMQPLLTVDVWEHAYYLDYQADRKKYVTAILDNLINWEFAEARLNQAAK